MTATDHSVAAESFRPGELEIDADGSGHLLGSRCRACGAHFFPVRQVCAGCLGSDLESVRFSTAGTLYTYTVVHRPVAPGQDLPFVIAVVELDGAEGVRLISNLVDTPPEELRVGMAVEVVWEDMSPDLAVPRFRASRE